MFIKEKNEGKVIGLKMDKWQQNIVRIFTLTRFCFHIKTIKKQKILSKLCGKKLIGTSQKCDMLLRNEQKIRNFNNEAKVFRKSQLNYPTFHSK